MAGLTHPMVDRVRGQGSGDRGRVFNPLRRKTGGAIDGHGGKDDSGLFSVFNGGLLPDGQ
jgi:hypothetical protein